MCLVEGCEYICTNGLLCFSRHIKSLHGGDKQTPFKLCPVAFSDVSVWNIFQNSKIHTDQCLSLVQQTMHNYVDRNMERRQQLRKEK